MFVTFYTTKWLNIMATPTALSHVDKTLTRRRRILRFFGAWSKKPISRLSDQASAGMQFVKPRKTETGKLLLGGKTIQRIPKTGGWDVKGNTAPQWIMGKKEAGLKSAEILSKRRRVKLAWVKIEFQELTIPWAKFRGSGKASKGKLFECI